ncbi:hypothetical protein Tsubulata_008366 [Turnera subulata]|uniref:Serine-threonine/tyrosine-protein kinase catalytic domain-containing protein n=1 Tax=Turnera subulata TaxID=218843 RepID=A0A9Q0FHR9_9ROSI|nr:hypothetical protein Tsubulata_008366 [Turnera subulata]
MELLDQRIPPPRNRVANGLACITRIGLACLNVNPISRPTMRQVFLELIPRRPPLAGAYLGGANCGHGPP